MSCDFDLLGDPIPEGFGRRGRPAHVPTERNRNKIRLLMGFGWTDQRIAQALRITRPTLKKHYFSELRLRDEARPALEAARIDMIYQAAKGGNVGAMKELGRMIEDDVRPPQRLQQEPKLGKKEIAQRDAETAHEGSAWGDLLH